MQRVVEDILDRTRLHDAAAIHDDDAVDRFGDDAEIMRDHHEAHARLGLDVLDELQDLRLDGDVERGGGFVGDQHRRLAGQRHRDHHAL